MPPWVISAMKINSGDGPFLPMKFERPNTYLEWLAEQPAGTWIMGFNIAQDGTYHRNALTIASRADPGPLSFCVAQRIPSSITNVSEFEDDMIKAKLPIRKGGFGNPSLRAQHQYAALVYSTPVYDEESYAALGSQLAQLNMAGHLAHVK